MLASLYVFLLLIAYAVTYALSRSIIRPLSLLSEKVQELKFTDKNDPLVYAGDNQDEISELIAQYNAMGGQARRLEAATGSPRKGGRMEGNGTSGSARYQKSAYHHEVVHATTGTGVK
jgi:nitrogen fixation/metabolism regulation signal transduction histidine kinase